MFLQQWKNLYNGRDRNYFALIIPQLIFTKNCLFPWECKHFQQLWFIPVTALCSRPPGTSCWEAFPSEMLLLLCCCRNFPHHTHCHWPASFLASIFPATTSLRSCYATSPPRQFYCACAYSLMDDLFCVFLFSHNLNLIFPSFVLNCGSGSNLGFWQSIMLHKTWLVIYL